MREMGRNDTKYRARIAILSDILSFPTIRNKDWTSDMFDDRGKMKPGDLVAMNAAPPSKWYLSWLHEVNPNNGWPKYLLESIEDGELCWWENVGLSFYNRENIRPSWKWTDAQFGLNDRWMRMCREFMVRPLPAVFNEDGSVTLNVRIRYSLDDYHNPTTFPDWKKLTMKKMASYYKDSVNEYELIAKGNVTQ